ncbi:MAG: hypothetical protein ABJN22_12365 [Litorimonas sp.]
MIRSLFFTLLLAFLSLSLTPQTAVAQSSELEADAVSEAIIHSDEDIERAYRSVKRDEAYQLELAEPIPRRPPSAFEKALGRFFNAIFSFLAPLLEIIFWLGLGALALGAVYLIGRAVYETRFAKPASKKIEEPDIPLYQPAEAQARILLDEVDKLAAEGRYGEAVHTLLFRSIQDIDRNRPNVVRRSLTAREIGGLSVLTAHARTAFSTIAGVSELAHFGGVSVNKSGFETARNAYADLTGQTTAPKRSRR